MDLIPTEMDNITDPCAILFSPNNFLWLALYSVLFLVAVGGNCLACCVVLGQKRMRTVTNFFLLNLAVSDILKGIFCIPWTFVVNGLFRYWPFGEFMCRFVHYTQAVFVFLSGFTLVAMSIDRYVAIVYPLRPKLTTKKVCVIIVIVWVFALAFPLPTLILSRVTDPYGPNKTTECHRGMCLENIQDPDLRHTYSTIIMSIQYFIPLAVLKFTYCRIGYIIWIKRTPGEAERRRDERIASSKRKMVKMMIVMVIMYAVCWLPIHVLKLIEDGNTSIYDFTYYQQVWTCAHWLSMSYACYNPIVYFWMNKRFRVGFKKLFFFCCRSCKRYRSGSRTGRPTGKHYRNNSGSSSRFSPRDSIDETKVMKMTFVHKGDCELNDLRHEVQCQYRKGCLS